MNIEIDDRQEKIHFTDDMKSLLQNIIKKTLEYEQMTDCVEIGIILVDNEQIKQMNKEFREIDQETDVLSFPMLEYEGYDEDDATIDLSDLAQDIDPETHELLLGDIVISLEKAMQQASEYAHTFERESGFLVVHGMLHLLGYDHVTKNDEIIMREKEEEILDHLNLCQG